MIHNNYQERCSLTNKDFSGLERRLKDLAEMPDVMGEDPE